jgi:hypothetical protein
MVTVRILISTLLISTLLALLVPFQVLGASTPPRISQDRFGITADAMKGSSSLRAFGVEKCVSRIRAMPRSKLTSLALVIDASIERAPQILCERLVAAMVSGRLSYDDYIDGVHRHLTTKMLHIVQGRD